MTAAESRLLLALAKYVFYSVPAVSGQSNFDLAEAIAQVEQEVARNPTRKPVATRQRTDEEVAAAWEEDRQIIARRNQLLGI